MKKPFGQRVAFALALVCYVAAAACVIAAFLYQSRSPEDAVRAALMASVVFFIGCGVVLHVIGTARLEGLLSGKNENLPGE